MRRGSLTNQTSIEPVIVVDEPAAVIPEENEKPEGLSPQQSFDLDSPTMNPYLLSPWRDPREVRKHSLPTPQCAGITASQVRRLSDRGGEGPSPREAAFLATLSQAPAPSPGGRRHSVVTISKVPSTLFGRNRRESIAAFPTGVAPSRILGSRRESVSGAVGPPSTEHRGSIHNLQLDIMDDIVTARKVRMKMWNTSNEKVCEVQPLDEAASSSTTQRYTQPSALRRFSDYVSTPLTAIPKRRSSEYIPSNVEDTTPTIKEMSTQKRNAGIVCSNTDLIFILSNLTSSATEINQIADSATDQSKSTLEQKRSRLQSKRSNSFDVSILYGTDTKEQKNAGEPGPSSWFVKRHLPMSSKKDMRDTLNVKIKSATSTTVKERKSSKDGKDSNNKVVWDGRSGSLVDASALGSAIEVFLRKTGMSETTSNPTPPASSPSKGAIPKTTTHTSKSSSGKASRASGTTSSGWYSSSKDTEDETTESCDTSLCSTLKDLFVK